MFHDQRNYQESGQRIREDDQRETKRQTKSYDYERFFFLR